MESKFGAFPEVQKRFGVERPEQVIDYLGMMGDASDNIPGLPGVGDKTAKKFLADFGDMEGLLANTDQLKGKMKEKVEQNAELGRLSRKLAEIKIDCDVTFNADDYEMSEPDGSKVNQIFDELEFRRLKDQFIKIFSEEEAAPETNSAAPKTPEKPQVAGSGQFSLFGGSPADAPATIKDANSRDTISEVSHLYQSIQPGLGLKLFIEKLMQQTSVCFDTETTSINPLEAELVGIAFSWEAKKGFYVPIPEEKEAVMEILEQLRPFFESEDIEKVGQNLKYDIKVMKRYGVEVKGKLFRHHVGSLPHQSRYAA